MPLWEPKMNALFPNTTKVCSSIEQTNKTVCTSMCAKPFWWGSGLFELFQSYTCVLKQPTSVKNKQCTIRSEIGELILMVWRFSSQGRVRWDFTQFLGSVYGCAWAQPWHEVVLSCNHLWHFNPVQPRLAQCTSYSFGFADFAQPWSLSLFGFCHCDFQQSACDSHVFVLSITGSCSRVHLSALLC